MIFSKKFFALSVCAVSFAAAAVKPHTVTFGKWTTVPWFAGRDSVKPVDLKVRPLFVDGRTKEFTVGLPHDVTERLFVVQRAFRLNDALPGDKTPGPNWRWERGGWLLVDRVTSHITAVSLPEFDAFASSVSWYRDYAAYCGVSDDGQKMFLVVAQLGRRRPVLKKSLAGTAPADAPDSACLPPGWEREPVRVTFTMNGGENSTYEVRGHAVDLVREDVEEEAGAQ